MGGGAADFAEGKILDPLLPKAAKGRQKNAEGIFLRRPAPFSAPTSFSVRRRRTKKEVVSRLYFIQT